MKKKLLAVFLVVLIAAAAIGAVFLIRGDFLGNLFASSSGTVVNVSNLQQQILSIGELATLQYDYTNVVELKNSRQIKGWDVPLTQKTFIVVLDGTMKIGIDTSGIAVDAPENSQTISVTIPKAKILSHEIHEDTLKVLNQKSGLFNTVQIEDYTTLAASEKKAMEDKASSGDMFIRAENDAVKMLQALIAGIVPAEYTVEVTVSVAP